MSMKFSLLFLMALILVVAMVTNGFQMHAENERVQFEILLLRMESTGRNLDTLSPSFEQQRLIHQRVEDSHRILQPLYATAEPNFRRLAEKYNQLDVDDPGEFAIDDFPTFRHGRMESLAWRVHIPGDSPRRLQVDFLTPEKEPLLSRSLFYKPAGPWSIELPTGESEIYVQWSDQKDNQAVVIRLNQHVIREYRCSKEVFGWEVQTPESNAKSGSGVSGGSPVVLVWLRPFDTKVMPSWGAPMRIGESEKNHPAMLRLSISSFSPTKLTP